MPIAVGAAAPRRRAGRAARRVMGRLAGIARHARPKGPVEVIGSAHVGFATGIAGDYRGAMRPGGRRQVTMMAAADWSAAMRELDRDDLVWSDRRVNLLTDGVELPRAAGARVRIGDVVFEITGECDPCSRMDAIAAGLRAVLTPDWRGGRLLRVRSEGFIAVGDAVTVEDRLAEAI